jgi:SagB-type dehydrogenase family enzyme
VTKLVIVAAPIVAFALIVMIRALSGRALSRQALNVSSALILLLYVLITAGLGVFWVARMDLPAFDWHYLFGYCTLVLLVVHLGFQVRVLATFSRRLAPPAWLSEDRRRFRPLVRGVFATIAAVILLSPIAFLVAAARPGVHRVERAPSGPAEQAMDPALAREPERISIERKGTRMSVADYLQAESSYSRIGVLRPSIARTRPGDARELSGERLSLPPAQPHADRTLDQALARDRDGHYVVRRASPSKAASPGEIATLLQHAAGITSRAQPGLALRSAASSGALYPTDLYVVLGAGGALPRGVHYYHPHDHALVRIAADTAAVTQSLPSDSPLSSAPLVIVFGSTFDRTVTKYGLRSYRYVGLDAGHIAANLLVAAAAIGWTCVLEPLFDDERLAAAVGSNGDGEGVVLAAGCGPTQLPERSLRTLPPHALPELPERIDAMELTRLSHRLTSWRLIPGEPLGTGSRPRPPEAETPLKLPAASALTMDVFETIAQRRSFRDYARGPLTGSELRALLAAADAAPLLAEARHVEIRILVRALEGLEPGVYRWQPGLRTLAQVARGDVSSKIEQAGLSQELLGRAAVVFAWTLIDASLGVPRDWRHALIEAGIQAEQIYLAATALGLGACGVGAFYDDEVSALLRGEARAVHLMGVGRR